MKTPKRVPARPAPKLVTARPKNWTGPESEDDLYDYPHPVGDDAVDVAPEWEPRYFVDLTLPGNPSDRGVPTIDDDLDADPNAAPLVYPAWRPGETIVVSGPCGPGMDHVRGRWFGRRTEARKWAREKYGVILEEWLLPYRWSFRVPTPGGPHDPRKVVGD